MDAPVQAGAMTHTAQVVIETGDFTCDGLVHVKTGGYRTRVSDMLNDESSFIAVTDVTVQRTHPESGQNETAHYDTIILRKGEIKYVIPLD